MNVCLPVGTLPQQLRRAKCRRFYKEYISTWSVKTKAFLKALIKSSCLGYYQDVLLTAVN